MGPLLKGLFHGPEGEVVAPLLRDPHEDRWVCRGIATHHFLRCVCGHFDIRFEDASAALSEEPEDSLALLDSPRGWAVLADRIATRTLGSLKVDPLSITIN